MDNRYVERMEQAFKHKRYFIDIIRQLSGSRTPQQMLNTAIYGYNLGDMNHPYILDYGCGSGLLTYRLAEAFPSTTVVGYDQSLEMVEIARERFSAPNLHFTTREDEVKGKEYDYIVLSSVLHEVFSQNYILQDVNIFLDSLSKYLKQGGYIITRDNYLSKSPGTQLRVQFLNEREFYQAVIFYDALLNHLPEELTGYYSSLLFDGDMLTISGSEPKVREFMNKLTWGLESLPREAKEILFFSYNSQFDQLGDSTLKLVARENYCDHDYLGYLEKRVHTLKESEWNTHTWRIFKKID